MQFEERTDLLNGRTVWLVRMANQFDANRTLLLSKVSEAIQPNTPGNHIGEGSTMDEFLAAQPGVRFIVNGGFNHYRKDYYDWPHQNFQVGDPVGLVKIRSHVFEDLLEPRLYGFFVQSAKGQPWAIVTAEQLDKSSKYILGCTPLLIQDGKPTKLPAEHLKPVPRGTVNPPSILGHGLQRHARTAVGLRADELVFVVVEGDHQQGGCTLPELQELGLRLELDSFLNLDGGGSSQFRLRGPNEWVRNRVHPEDENRILGNVIVLFEETLKAADRKKPRLKLS